MDLGAVGAAMQGGAAVFDILDRNRQENRRAHSDRMAASANADLQREFAKNGIRWKVEDARRAGVSPALAMGASTIGATPVHIGEERGPVFGEAGQDLGRAISATSTGEERVLQKLRVQSAQLDIEGKALDNQIRASQLKRLGSSPAFPGSDNFIPGQGDSGVKINPSERTQHQPGHPGQDKGWITDKAYARTATGMVPVPSKDVTERIEDKLIPEMMWAWRNSVMPNFGGGEAPSQSQLPKGFDTWRWDYWNQEYVPAKLPYWAKDPKNYGR